MIGCQTILSNTYGKVLAGTGYTILHAAKKETNTIVFNTHAISI